MKSKLFLTGAAALCFFLYGCKKGDKGDAGAPGAPGTNGSNGANGKTALVRTTSVAPGSNCSLGGVRIETGVDTNGNGQLDDAEVTATQTRYICNGVNGTNGTNGLNGQAGQNGQNGQNGSDGFTALTRTTVEAAGGNCGTGGVKVEVGVDANRNNTLDDAEVVTAMTRYICNGAAGTNGANGTNGTNGTNGLNSLIRTTPEPAGPNCTYGGVTFEFGYDTNNNDILDNSEVITAKTTYVCNPSAVIYSNWIKADLQPVNLNDIEEARFQGKQLLNVPKLTQEIADGGIVLMYFKNSAGIIFPVDRDFNGSISDHVGATPYYITSAFTYEPGSIRYLSLGYLTDYSDYIPFDLLRTLGDIRYILVPGSISGRSSHTAAQLKAMSYKEVAKIFNIQ
ncbi:MAG TPA: collagen-like protein [Flavisolibacter sp.]|nr:collagen-like protein [Flavisolibacter sp.]